MFFVLIKFVEKFKQEKQKCFKNKIKLKKIFYLKTSCFDYYLIFNLVWFIFNFRKHQKINLLLRKYINVFLFYFLVYIFYFLFTFFIFLFSCEINMD